MKKLQKLITPENKSKKQQNRLLLILFIGNQNFPQIWSSAVNRFEVIKKHGSVKLWPAVR